MAMYGGRCGQLYPPIPDYGPGAFCLGLTGATDDVVTSYVYRYQGDPAAVGATLNYTLQTWPQTVSSTGTRGFFVDASMAIRHCTCGGAGCTADATDAPIEQMPVDC